MCVKAWKPSCFYLSLCLLVLLCSLYRWRIIRQLLLAKLQGSHPRWRSCLGCATCPLALCGQSSAMPCSAKPCLSKKGGATIALGSCKACHRRHQPAIGVRFQASTLKAEFFKVYDLKQNKLCVNTGLFCGSTSSSKLSTLRPAIANDLTAPPSTIHNCPFLYEKNGKEGCAGSCGLHQRYKMQWKKLESSSLSSWSCTGPTNLQTRS